MGQLDSKLHYVSAAYYTWNEITIRSYVNPFSFHCHQGQEMFQPQMGNIFGAKNGGRNTNVFSERERKKNKKDQTRGCGAIVNS